MHDLTYILRIAPCHDFNSIGNYREVVRAYVRTLILLKYVFDIKWSNMDRNKQMLYSNHFALAKMP